MTNGPLTPDTVLYAEWKKDNIFDSNFFGMTIDYLTVFILLMLSKELSIIEATFK